MDDQSLMREWASSPFRLELYELGEPRLRREDGKTTRQRSWPGATSTPKTSPACSPNGTTRTRLAPAHALDAGVPAAAGPLASRRRSPHDLHQRSRQARRVFFADIFTPMRLTGAGLAALPGRHLALQQDTDNGLVFRVEADTAEQAASQVIGMVGDVGVIGAIYPADDILASQRASPLRPSMAPSIRAFRPCWPLDCPTSHPTTTAAPGAGISHELRRPQRIRRR